MTAVVFSGIALVSYVVLVFVTLRQNRRDRVHQAFALYLGAMSFWQLMAVLVSVAQQSRWALTCYRLMTTGLVGQFVFYLNFTLIFLGRKTERVFSRIGYLAFVALLALTPTGLIIRDVSRSGATGLFVPSFGVLVPVVGVVSYACLGFAFACLVGDWRQSPSEPQGKRLLYLMIGAGVIALGSLSNLFPVLQEQPIDVAANVVNAWLIAYVILRYQLLDIRLVVRKGMLYSIPTAAIGSLYFLVIYLLVRLFHFVAEYQILLVSFVVATVAGVAAQPVRVRAQDWVDRLFFRERYDSGVMLERLSRNAAYVLDLDALTDMILSEVVSVMHVERAALFLQEGAHAAFRLAGHKGLAQEPRLALRADHPIVDWLSRQGGPLVRRDIDVLPQFKSLWEQEREDLDWIGAELFMPLRAKGDLVGVFAVGPKRSQEPYSRDDRLTLTTLANQTAMAIENARLYREARQELRERRRAEEALRQAHAELEVRVQERTAELAEANELLTASLSEKEVLLEEIHHRVKNNLQVISSLLGLQSGYTRDPQALETLRDSQHRIRSMALIHEKLYQSDDLSRVDFADYVESLAAFLLRSYGVTGGPVSLKVEADSISLGLDAAIPCGLILNELVSNALKHAFPNGRGGQVTVGFGPGHNGDLVLTVSDDGVGLPEGLDPTSTDTLGLRMVSLLAGQLDGTAEFVSDHGTQARVTFTRRA